MAYEMICNLTPYKIGKKKRLSDGLKNKIRSSVKLVNWDQICLFVDEHVYYLSALMYETPDLTLVFLKHHICINV